MDIKEKLLANVLICKTLLDDIGKEVEEIHQTNRGYWSYFDCNKDKINRSRIVIGEKLLEIEKAAKGHRQGETAQEHEGLTCDDEGNCVSSTVLESFKEDVWEE